MRTVVKSAGRVVYVVQTSEDKYLSLVAGIWVPTSNLLELYRFPNNNEAEIVSKSWRGSRVILVTEILYINGEYL